MLLAVAGLCCFPLGLVAFAMGFGAFRRAKRDGVAPPGTALVSMGLGVLSLVFAAGFVSLSVHLANERKEASAALQGKLAQRLGGETVDLETACDLGREFLIRARQQAPDRITCAGPLDGAGVLRLRGVASGSERELTLCLARAHRWFVFGMPADGECPTAGPALPKQKPADEVAFQAQEEELRATEETRRAAAAIARFDERLAKLTKALDATEPGTKAECPGGEMKDLAFVDAAQLRHFTHSDEWEFLTHRDFRQALSRDDAGDRVEAIDALAKRGTRVVVFQDDSRRWPKVLSGNMHFDAGAFVGWARLVDLKSGAVLCDAELKFSNSTAVDTFRLTKLESKEHALESALEKDLEKHFEAAVAKLPFSLVR